MTLKSSSTCIDISRIRRRLQQEDFSSLSQEEISNEESTKMKIVHFCLPRILWKTEFRSLMLKKSRLFSKDRNELWEELCWIWILTKRSIRSTKKLAERRWSLYPRSMNISKIASTKQPRLIISIQFKESLKMFLTRCSKSTFSMKENSPTFLILTRTAKQYSKLWKRRWWCFSNRTRTSKHDSLTLKRDFKSVGSRKFDISTSF